MHPDPTDRFTVAAAVWHGAPLATRDVLLLESRSSAGLARSFNQSAAMECSYSVQFVTPPLPAVMVVEACPPPADVLYSTLYVPGARPLIWHCTGLMLHPLPQLT